MDKSVNRDTLLADAPTGSRGNYAASFPVAALKRCGKDRPDLQARVFSGERFLAASEVRYDAKTVETIDVLLPDTATAALASEYEALTTAIRSHYDANLRDLKESEEQRDLTYLANKTGWDARAVALAALADQFAARAAETKAEIPPVFFYALFRAGVPANYAAVYQSGGKAVGAIWRRAAEQGVIPIDAAEQIPAVLEQFQRLSAEHLLTSEPVAGVSTLTEMLAASGVPTDRRSAFASLYTTHRGDLPAFWRSVVAEFGDETASRLQIDGKLGFLTLNNAPLISVLRKALADGSHDRIDDPVELAKAGYYRPEKWAALLDDSVVTPPEIPGATPQEKRENYGEYLAAEVRLSYPTASIADKIGKGELAISFPDRVREFLTEQQGAFELGMQPIEQYLARKDIQPEPEVVGEIKRLQRVYQITPSDRAMEGLLRRGIDAAYHVVRYDKQTFRTSFADDLGGPDEADRVHDRSMQLHNTVLNLVIGYVTARNGVPLAALPPEPGAGTRLDLGIRPGPPGAAAPRPATDVIAYPTLETLFGEMDFCACEHCRSVLSPAAYLVDLLNFIDNEKVDPNPYDVLLGRRPDLAHLPLTCENTNKALPYIDVVNETLEYFIANENAPLSLGDFEGHDTGSAESADLLASPQYVNDMAYTILRDQRFPTGLPFHQPLENARLYLDKFETSVELAMERLRVSDELDRGAQRYGWRDILMESLGMSRPEYEILTDSEAVPLWRAYGFPDRISEADVIDALSNAKAFARRLQITYEDLITLLQTRFVNPDLNLIPKLERLGVPFTTLKLLKLGPLTDEAFDALLPTGSLAPDPAEYEGDIKAWVRDPGTYARIMGLVVLVDPTGEAPVGSFDTLELRRAEPITDPDDTSTRLGAVAFTRLLRLIRLWRRTGWTIQQTDAAVCALYRTDLQYMSAEDIDTVEKLDTGFGVLLPRLGIFVRTLRALKLTPQRELLSLLALWAPIGTDGPASLYRQLFLDPTLLKRNPTPPERDPFADNGYGRFLVDPNTRLAEHSESVRAACQLTGDEYDQIVAGLGYDENTALNLQHVSEVFRHGYLARKLRISVRELLLLISMTGLDPFAAPDPTRPAILKLAALVQSLRDRSVPSEAALYLIWNQDLSGRSTPTPAQIAELARTLRGDFAAIDEQFAVTEDPGGDLARTRMTLVYGDEAAGAFFALLDGTIVVEVGYTHPQLDLESAITAADPRLTYDDFGHRLSHTGLLDATTADALKAVAGAPAEFATAVDALLAHSVDAHGSFFALHPELQPLYETYVGSAAPVADKRAALLSAFRPELSRRRKRQQTIQRLSADVDVSLPQAILDPPTAPYPLHAARHPERPALDDVLKVQTPGLAVKFYFRDTATGPVDQSGTAADLDYSVDGSNPLPANPIPGESVSGTWDGQLETPESGFFNIVVETDAGATVRLALDGRDLDLTRNGEIRRNSDPLELTGGQLYDLTLTVENVRRTLRVKWETPKRSREPIPGRYLYPPDITEPFTATYVRFLKAASLAAALPLTAGELSHFATAPEYAIDGEGWLNALPVTGDPSEATAAALLAPLRALLDYARIRSELRPPDGALLAVLQDPVEASGPDGTLLAMTGWNRADLDAVVVAHFGRTVNDLANFELFGRVYDALALARMAGIAATSLIAATTNEPSGDTVRELQIALRARYSAEDWRSIVQPINDNMREAQRDALVAHILHHMAGDEDTAHIDTADKLFEYFLMDVEMQSCMRTSRIRHALSSVQLFIERCLMNLEPDVSPARIDSRRWEWMKRYRVWEANRKVFLFAENWLEPELRDDKSPFFKEIESELLQADVTEESATTALLNYLAKLEDVAKLEPCGLHHIEQDAEATPPVPPISHVIAHTAGARRTYYYRSLEHGSWTPWEQIKLDIEGNPVVPYVWRGRLMLFWLRILQEAPIDANQLTTTSPNSDPVTSLSLADIRADAKTSAQKGRTKVQAVLCWSEYYNGKWQAVKTSDLDRPTDLASFPPAGAGAFDRSQLIMDISEENTALRVKLSNQGSAEFLMYNSSSVQLGEDAPLAPVPVVVPPTRGFAGARTGRTNLSLSFTYTRLAGRPDIWARQVLRPDIPFDLVFTRHKVDDPWNAPFLLTDRRHAFYVTSTDEPKEITTVEEYWTQTPFVLDLSGLSPLIVKKVTQVDLRPIFWGNGIRDDGYTDPVPMTQFLAADPLIRLGLATVRPVLYDGQRIGPAGAIVRLNRIR
ncbi:neuraminidase-like domain-containing protein [Rhodococcus jostii]|uniref:neuraminidase-like domain-containing protein n=1 Tax=Rhodococcus jostii TaxID=132919 RepID=UPI00142F3B8A|nr:neuraminidase-like domain-containing protein [Rhodococcus jostii]